jgi:peptidoglycan/LPS O-acetylase OafA/YrhL
MRKKVLFADRLRGIAALTVVVFHLSVLAWDVPTLNYFLGSDGTYSTPEKSPAFLALGSNPFFYLGAFGVALFFIISGFVIPFALRRYTIRGFLEGRFFRIYPVYLAGISTGLICLMAYTRLKGTAFPASPSEVGWQLALGLRDIVGSKNLDGIVWTLEIELKFYLIACVLAPLLRRGSLYLFLFPLFLFLVGVAGTNFIIASSNTNLGSIARLADLAIFNMRYLIFMFVGIAFFMHRDRKINRLQLMLFQLGCFAGFAILVWLAWEAENFRTPLGQIQCYGIAILVFNASYAFPKLIENSIMRPLDFFARISYSLYVVHILVGMILVQVLHSAGASPLFSSAVSIVSVVLLSWTINITIEMPTGAFGRKIAKRSDSQ